MTRFHKGFTLVELLLVTTIIGILTGITVTVTRQVYHTSRVAKTDATLQKLDRVILEMYAEYENRRVPSPNFGNSPVAAQVTQAARLWFLRDMIRMEMPSSSAEVKRYHSIPNNNDDKLGPALFRFRIDNNNGNIVTARAEDSPLRRLYESTLQSCNGNYESAKCLFLIVMYGNPEARELFFDSEIATDDDGLSYFVDGWGNPIYFLRWAPGLALSERQPSTDAAKAASPDPLDPTEVGGMINLAESNPEKNIWLIDIYTNPATAPQVHHGWTLLPVILSSGGVRENDFDASFGIILRPEEGAIPVVDPFKWQLGTYSDQPNYAVIHNHSSRR